MAIESYKELIDDWGRFIGKKGEQDRSKFLVGILKQQGCTKILDAALGIGKDTISLIKEGFIVTSNEKDKEFVRKARENASDESVKLKVTSQDWCDLSKFKQGSFDGVMLLGNSLTELPDKESQLKALAEFYRVLRYGGILILDERNHQDMLDRREEIATDPLAKFSLRHKNEYGRATYSEDGGVRGVPTQISDDKIVFSYYDTKVDRWFPTTLPGYPFKKGELIGLLKETGFLRITQYSDFRKGYDPQADFYEYIAEKGERRYH